MQKADAVLMPVTHSLTISRARVEANKAGARIMSLPGMTERSLIQGCIEMDFIKARPIVEKVASLFTEADEARITTDLGSNLRMKLTGKTGTFELPMCTEPGCLGNIGGEARIAPLEDTAEGVLFVDAIVIPYIGDGLIKNPIKVVFEKGRIVDIQGEDEARKFRELLESFSHPNVYRTVELGMGLNPYAKMGMAFSVEDDETKYGTMHIGIGEGRGLGSTISAPAHLDMVFLKPTLELDGRTIMKDGQLVIEGAKESLFPS
jgi:leucyl aminopeptidase (aminopeptidase T)